MRAAGPRLNVGAARRLLETLANPDLAEQSDPTLPKLDGYILLRRLGGGGGGEVFQGVRAGSDRLVAIKILHGHDFSETAQRRAWRELDLLVESRSPALPRVHDYGAHAGRMFIVTDFIEGLPVAAYCDTHRLDRRSRVELLVKIAQAVQEALHERGILHRDLKPSNVLIDSAGQPVIIDLGIAQAAHDDFSRTLTEAGKPIGTLAFMSPEQARGERNLISTRSDVYGLGAMAYQTLIGQGPHPTDLPAHELLRRVANEQARLPHALDPTFPKPLAAVLSKATAYAPEQRYATAGEFAADLQRWLNNEPVTAAAPSLLTRLNLYRKRRKGTFAAIIAGVVLFVGLIGAIGWGILESNQRQAAVALAQQREEFAAKQQEFAVRLGTILRDSVQNIKAQLEAGELQRPLELMYGVREVIKASGPLRSEIALDDIEARLDATREEIAKEILEFLYPERTPAEIQTHLAALHSTPPKGSD